MPTRDHIRLECAPDTLAALGEGFLDGFAMSHPEVCLDIREASDRQVDSDVAQAACDMALVSSPYHPQLVTCEIYCCPVCFWMRPDNALADIQLLCIKDLEGRRIAMAGAESKAYDRLMRLAESHDVQLGGVTQLSEAHLRHAFASESDGLGFTLRHLREHPLFKTASVVAAPMEAMSWSFAAAYARGRTLTPAQQAFWDWCRLYRERLVCDEWCNRHIAGTCTRQP